MMIGTGVAVTGSVVGAKAPGPSAPPDTDPPTILTVEAYISSTTLQRGSFTFDEPCTFQWRSKKGALGSWSDWSDWSSTPTTDSFFWDYMSLKFGDYWFFEINARDVALNPATNNGAGDNEACPY